MLVHVTPTVSQVEGLTRNQLIKRLVPTGLVKVGTATSGSTTTLVDTNRLKSSQFNSKEWVGGWARISYDAGAAAGAPENEVSPIITYTPSTGTITFDPVVTAAIAVGDQYELWKIDPRVALDLIDQALQDKLYFPCWTILSEVPDYDMEQTANTTDWGTTSSTIAKGVAEPHLFGKGKLRVTASAALGNAWPIYAIDVIPGKTYHYSAVSFGRTGNINTNPYESRLRIYDQTNGAFLDSYVDYTCSVPLRLNGTVTIQTERD